MKKYILGFLLSLVILVSPAFAHQAEAAGLTSAQISSIISILQSFGVDQSVINNVQISLGGGVSTNATSATSATSTSASSDLCIENGLSNIDETNWESMRASHVGVVFSPLKDNPINYGLALGRSMSPGESYSLPIWTKMPESKSSYGYAIEHNPYFSTPYPFVIHISDKKCDFAVSSRFGKRYFFIINGGETGSMMSVSVDPTKYEDPNYDFDKITPREWQPIKLTAGKKYYMNVRWLRKSDIVDNNGNLKDTLFGKPINDRLGINSGLKQPFLDGRDASTFSKTELNSILDNKFNSKGDACLGADKCFISFIEGENNMSVVTKSQYDKYAAERAASIASEVGPSKVSTTAPQVTYNKTTLTSLSDSIVFKVSSHDYATGQGCLTVRAHPNVPSAVSPADACTNAAQFTSFTNNPNWKFNATNNDYEQVWSSVTVPSVFVPGVVVQTHYRNANTGDIVNGPVVTVSGTLSSTTVSVPQDTPTVLLPGQWIFMTGPMETSPPPPVCSSLVHTGGSCEIGSICVTQDAQNRYQCQR